MKKFIGLLKNEEGGELILEFSYCYCVVMIVIMVLFSFGFYAYQKVMVSIVCNQATEYVSTTFKYRGLDLESVDNGTATEDMFNAEIRGVHAYRYILKKDDYISDNEDKLDNFIDYRLTRHTISFAHKTEEPQVEVSIKEDGYGRYHYEVCVHQKFEYLLGDIMDKLGIPWAEEIKYTAYGEGTDMSAYLNCVTDWKYGVKKDGSGTIGSSAASAVSFWHACFD